MSFWRWLFGAPEETPVRPPAPEPEAKPEPAAEPGPVTQPEPKPEPEAESKPAPYVLYIALGHTGPLDLPSDLDGPVELRVENRPEWVLGTGLARAGQMHGCWEHTTVQGSLMRRTHYRDGVRHGEHHDRVGLYLVDGSFVDDQPEGKWSYRRRDDSLVAEVDFAGGEVVSWRWLRPDGAELEPKPAADREAVQRWLDLGEGVHQRLSTVVLRSLEAFEEPELGHAIEWFQAQRLEAPMFVALPTLNLPDLRHRCFDVANELSADHSEWTLAQLEQIVDRAPQLEVLALLECGTYEPEHEPKEGGVESLLEDGEWPRLAALSFEESGDLDRVVQALVVPDRFPALLSLRLGGVDDDGLSPEALHALTSSALLTQLTALSLKIGGFSDLAELSEEATPRLERLELYTWDEDTDLEVLRRLTDAALRPSLVRLQLNGAPGLDVEALARPGLQIESR